MYKAGMVYIVFKIKKLKLIQSYPVTQEYVYWRYYYTYTACTGIAVVQQHFHQNLLFKLYQVKEKKYNKYQSLFLQTDAWIICSW